MRLTSQQINLIVDTVLQQLGSSLSFLGLYGSRTNDSRRGGDVDLLIEVTSHIPLLHRAGLKMELEAGLGLPVDLLVVDVKKPLSPFQQMARARAVELRVAA